MTVSSQTNNVTFVGNGVATAFPLPFRFFKNSDIRAYFIDSTTGAATPMVLGTDYTLIGAGEPEVDGSALSLLTTTNPLANGRGLYVERIMQEVQSTDIVNQGEFFASTHEDVFDRLTMLVQQANANSNGAIRVAISDPEPQRLLPAAQRAGLVLAFDENGQPITVAPASGSATDLAIMLYNSADPLKGFALVGTVQFGLGKPVDPTPSEKGFWNDVLPGANIWKMRDRLLVGDAVDQNGNQFPGVGKTWVGNSAAGFMTYFDSRSQMAVYSSKGYIGGAFASRSSDNIGPAELNTIGVGSYVNNDNTVGANKKAAWAYYGHAVQEQPNEFTACMEVDICNSQALVHVSPYQMGLPGTTAAHWIGVGGETAQAGLSSQPASVAIAVVSTATRDAVAGTGSLFDKGLVFQADALSGCDGVTGSAIAVEMARGHRVNWLTPTNGYAAHIRSDNTATETAVGMVFVNNGVTFKGLKPDLVTEQNLLAVVQNPNAVNYLQLEAGATGAGPVVRATGADTNVDLNLFTKGSGLIRLGYAVANASVPANFAAQQMIAIKDISGAVYYIPCRAAAW